MDKREVLSAARNVAMRLGRQSVDIILPPQDPFKETESAWSGIKFLDAPWCAQCGLPFEYDMGEGALCGACVTNPPRYSTARAVMVYDDASRPLILSFKHGGKTQNLSRFAAQLRRVGREVLQKADFIIPVPLHKSRRIKRRYNQSVLLARALAKITDATFDPDILRRVKATPSQGGQSAAGRRRNVQGAFAVEDKAKTRLKDAHIILIDDVMTTGATVEACASRLFVTGAKRVDVLCLARVIRTEQPKKDAPHGQS
jgi:ComF family protein